MGDKYLYIVLTRTQTKTARMIRFVTKKTFSHVSLSYDEMLGDMYSFCRDNKRLPLPAHFNMENIHTEVFGDHDDIPCEVYRIPVTSAQFAETKRIIDHFYSNRLRYSYDVAALLTMPLRIPYKGKDRFVCSVWVGFVLGKSGISHNIKKHPALVQPEDFRHIPDAELIFEGNLKEYQDYILSRREKEFSLPREVLA